MIKTIFKQSCFITCIVLLIISFLNNPSYTATIQDENILSEITRLDENSIIMSLEVDSERELIFASLKDQGLAIYNASSPNYEKISSLYISEAHEIVYSSNFLYIASLNSGLKVVNVTNPVKPLIIDSFAHGSGAHATNIEIQNDIVSLGEWSDGIEFVNISNPMNIAFISSFQPSYNPSTHYLFGNYCYAETALDENPPKEMGLSILNITDLTSITELNFVSNYTGLAPSAEKGNYLFAGGLEEGLTVFDVSDPVHPSIISQKSNGKGNALQVASEGKYVFMTDSEDGIEVYDITNVANPLLLTNYDLSATAIHLRILNSKIIVATTHGLAILKFQDLGNISHSAGFNSAIMVSSIIVLSIIRLAKTRKYKLK